MESLCCRRLTDEEGLNVQSLCCRRLTDEEEGLNVQSLYFIGALQMKKKVDMCKAYIL